MTTYDVNWAQLAALDENTKAFIREQSGKCIPAFTWALDFIRAYRERPRVLRLIAQICMGRYAYRELTGLYKALEDAGYDPDLPYGLEHMDYHHETINNDL